MTMTMLGARTEFAGPSRVARRAVRAVVVFGLLFLPAAGAGAGDRPADGGERILFGTVFQDLAGPGWSSGGDARDEIRARIATFQARAKAFRSRLPRETAPPGPERYGREKKRSLEKGIVCLIDQPGIETLARDYAARAVIAYEWEGMADGPLTEAAFAEQFLARNPQTPLKPYLHLFLAHRFRCASEAAALARDGKAAEQASAKYQGHLAIARRDADPLVRFVADDLGKRSYLYLEPSVDTRGGPAKTAGEPGHVAPGPVPTQECSDSAQPAPIADPHRWALDCFAVTGGDAAARPESLAEFEADIDQDGTAEMLIGSRVARGNAGGTHYVFRKQGAAYRYLGSLFLHPGAFKVLGRGVDGRPRMVRYRRLGAGEGLLETIVYDGQAFTVERSEKVFLPAQDAARPHEIFGGLFQGASGAEAQEYPPLSVDRAIALAETFVKKNEVNLSGQHIHTVTLRYDDSAERRGLYWHVQWMWTQPRIGGEYGLWVYMDGKVMPRPLGP